MAKRLFDEFDGVSAKAWKQKIQYDLKGADYNETLIWESPEGIHVKPFYHQDDLKTISPRGTTKNNPWKIGQELFLADAVEANSKALDLLQRGAESLIFNIPSKEAPIDQLLKGIDLAAVAVHFNLQFLSSTYVGQIIGSSKTNAEHHLNVDIIGHLARSGNWFLNQKEDHGILEKIVSQCEVSGSSTLLGIDMSLYQNAGADMVQQLGYGLAHANEYLNHGYLIKGQGISFKVAIGSNYFFEIAKLKAIRMLWATLAHEYDVSPNCHIIATPTRRNKTIFDFNVNMLRTTSECMSAVLGGADTVYNQPYDGIYHKNNEFGERIARNQLLIMKYEGHLDKVTNAADGTYYIESLTTQLAEKALALFKDIEANGGFLKQLKENTIQKKIKESAQKEQRLFDEAKIIGVGTNKYQNKNDRMKGDLERDPFVKIDKRKTLIEPIIEKRLAQELEQKRLEDE